MILKRLHEGKDLHDILIGLKKKNENNLVHTCFYSTRFMMTPCLSKTKTKKSLLHIYE